MQARLTSLCVLVLLSACTPAVDEPAAEAGRPPGQQSLSHQLPTLEPAAPDAEALAVPEGVDPQLWQELLAELERSIELPATEPSLPGPALFSLDNRTASFTPYGEHNLVRDLRLSGSGPWLLCWSYRNRGDYDLNGSVTISDLTPLGQLYGMRDSDPLWPTAVRADGDGNGELNIADVTEIGRNFGGTLVGYAVYGADSLDGEWTHIGNAGVTTHLHRNADRPRFVIRLDSLEFANYALWPYDGSADEGGWSNPASLASAPRRRISGLHSVWEN
ncbi:MAG: hypothetical protein R3F46_05495 [bacterium]